MPHRLIRRWSVRLLPAVLVAATIGVGGGLPAARAAVSSEGLLHTLNPVRVLDTRGSGAVRAGSVVTIPRSRLTSAGVPASGVQSVVLNLTVTGASAYGWATIFGGSKPATSNLNFTTNLTAATTVTVPLGAAGVSVSIDGGSTTSAQVIVDQIGWYDGAGVSRSGAATLLPFPATRVLDTRTTATPLGPGKSLDVEFTDDSGSAPTAVAVNLTVTGSFAGGFLTAYSGAGTPPTTSTINFGRAETVANQTVVPLRSLGGGRYALRITNRGWSSTHVILDLAGYYYSSSSAVFRHETVAPRRLLDTRAGSMIGPAGWRTVPVPAAAVDADGNTVSLEGTLTAVRPTAGSYLTILADSSSVPATSTVNALAGQVRANGYLTPLGAASMSVFNHAGRVDAVVDLTGRFDYDPSASAVSLARARALMVAARDQPVTPRPAP